MAQAKGNKDSIKVLYNKIQTQPLWFMNKVLARSLWRKQEDIVRSIQRNKKTTVKACHSVGKSFISGNLVLWFLYGYRPSIVLTTAPTWRQVEKLIWKEVRASYARSTVPLGGDFSPKSPELQMIQDQWYAAGLSTTDANKFQGFHEQNVLVIVDEAAGVGEAIFEGIEGVLASENAKLLLIGNPTNTTGAFFESFKDPGFHKITISAFDTPNFTWANITEDDIRSGEWVEKEKFARSLNGGKLLQPNMITPDWVADKYKRWKPGSPLYESKVAGNFPAQGNDTLIPISWVEAAIERWHDMQEKSNIIELGVDVAEYGSDISVVAPRVGDKCLELFDYSGIGIMDLAGEVINIHRKMKSTAIKVDVIGIGTGVQGRLAEQGFPAIRVNVAESPGGATPEEVDEMKTIFMNKRSQLWWNLRERLNPDTRVNPDPIGLPPDEEMTFDLTNIKYKIRSNGKIQIESKDELRKRIGRSSDRGDAIMLAFAPVDLLGTGEWEVNVR